MDKKQITVVVILVIVSIVTVLMAIQIHKQQEEISSLLLKKDNTTLLDQIDVLTEDNLDLRKRLASAEESVNKEITIEERVETILREFYIRDYYSSEGTDLFISLMDNLKEKCTDKGYKSFIGDQAVNISKSESIGAVEGPIYEKHHTTNVLGMEVYTSTNNDGSIDVLALFSLEVSVSYENTLDETTVTQEMFQGRMIYDPEKAEWMIDEVFINSSVLGVDFLDAR